jgi:transposase-like protein
MRTRLHANATTTPRTRALIQASDEPVAGLARRFGVSETTIRRWRGRPQGEVEDRSHVRHRLGQATTPEDEAIIAELRLRAGLGVDDIAEVMNRCVHPGLSRGSVWRALRRMGLNRREAVAAGPGERFEQTPFGFVHVDLKVLARLKGREGYVFVAIERATRFVHVEILPNRRRDTVAAAWTRFLDAFGHEVHTVLPPLGEGRHSPAGQWTTAPSSPTASRTATATAMPPGPPASTPSTVSAPPAASSTAAPGRTGPRPTAWPSASTAASARPWAPASRSATTPATAPGSPATPSARPSS